MTMNTTSIPQRAIKGFLALLAAFAVHVSALAGTITYYHNDLAGSPIAATNASGQVLWRESYRPYGERTTNSAASSGNDVWFTSRRQDVESGLVYMGARYYDPVAGRFASTDPKGFNEQNIHSHNRYAYANNNPYRYADPDGRDAVETIKTWWEGSLAGFRSESAGDAFMRVLSAMPAEAGALGAIGAIKAVGAEAKAAAKVAEVAERVAADSNKLNHIFGNSRHNLDKVVESLGSQEKAFDAIRSATELAVQSQKLTGLYEVTVQVGGAQVTVQGKVVEGVARIGTAYIP